MLPLPGSTNKTHSLAHTMAGNLSLGTVFSAKHVSVTTGGPKGDTF